VDEYERCFEEWKKDTLLVSSIDVMTKHPSYQAIIRLGMSVVPHILHTLQQEPNHLFHALCAITGENPVSPEDAGYVDRMALAWIEWGRERGLLEG